MDWRSEKRIIWEIRGWPRMLFSDQCWSYECDTKSIPSETGFRVTSSCQAAANLKSM